jgi:hypothetical protein
MSSSPDRAAGFVCVSNSENSTAWIDQCRARELAERAAAKRASSIADRRMHQELAQAYASLALERSPE